MWYFQHKYNESKEYKINKVSIKVIKIILSVFIPWDLQKFWDCHEH